MIADIKIKERKVPFFLFFLWYEGVYTTYHISPCDKYIKILQISDEADTTQTFHCEAGQVCTRGSKICVDEASAVPSEISCPRNNVCGKCQAGSTFVCTSRTKYAQCNGNERTLKGECPSGYYCSATTKGSICIEDTEGVYDCESFVEVA